MNGRSSWVGRLLAVGVVCTSVVAAADPAGLRVSVRAREIAPGEPLRIVVLSSEPLASLHATFLEQAVYMARTRGGQAEEWSGWTMIPLDREPGPVAIELDGTRENGGVVAATHAITIRAKQFPEERLSVSSEYVEPPPEVQRRLERERAKLAEVYRSRRTPAATDDVFVRPVPGAATSIFGTRRLYNGQPRAPHPGLDLRASNGTPVIASGPGVIALAEDLFYSGNTVIIDHGGGLFTIYAHLSRIDVDEGATVRAGDPIGLSGATGRVTGPHLHWGAKIGDRPFDPTALLDPALF